MSFSNMMNGGDPTGDAEKPFEFTLLPGDVQRLVTEKMSFFSVNNLKKTAKNMRSLCERSERGGFLPKFHVKSISCSGEEAITFVWTREVGDNNVVPEEPNRETDLSLIKGSRCQMVVESCTNLIWWRGPHRDRLREMDGFLLIENLQIGKLEGAPHLLKQMLQSAPIHRKLVLDEYTLPTLDSSTLEQLSGMNVSAIRQLIIGLDGISVGFDTVVQILEHFNVERFDMDASRGLDSLLCHPAVQQLRSLNLRWFDDLGEERLYMMENLVPLRAEKLWLPHIELPVIRGYVQEWLEGRREIGWYQFVEVTGIPSDVEGLLSEVANGVFSGLAEQEPVDIPHALGIAEQDPDFDPDAGTGMFVLSLYRPNRRLSISFTIRDDDKVEFLAREFASGE